MQPLSLHVYCRTWRKTALYGTRQLVTIIVESAFCNLYRKSASVFSAYISYFLKHMKSGKNSMNFHSRSFGLGSIKKKHGNNLNLDFEKFVAHD